MTETLNFNVPKYSLQWFEIQKLREQYPIVYQIFGLIYDTDKIIHINLGYFDNIIGNVQCNCGYKWNLKHVEIISTEILDSDLIRINQKSRLYKFTANCYCNSYYI